MQALKEAVNAFIDGTAAANEETAAQGVENRIALVTYASGSNIRSDFTTSFQSLKNTVSGLNANGGTYSDEGLSSAARVMNGYRGSYWEDSYDGARDEAQKVVIFFTDGGPGGTNMNPFNPTVANDTIDEARTLKDTGSLVYSVGVFEDADPSVTNDRMNAYMNAVSSNYPYADSYTNLGQGSTESGYYKAASSSEDLNNIFSEILDENLEASGSPTEVEDGAQNTDGYITFTDQLGDYMDVVSMKQIVYANNEFKLDENHPSDTSGNVTTYHYTGTFPGNGVYGEADMSNLIVQVTDGQGSVGDTVTVRIPASIIPLKYYSVTTENGETTASVSDTYPIRVFYSVGLRDSAATQIASGNVTDQQLNQYISNHTNSQTGEVEFFSNLWNGGANGDTVATFEPSEDNSFYYFTSNTPLYNSQDVKNPAQGDWVPEGWLGGGHYEFDYSGTYYYQRTYYTIENGTATPHEEWVELSNAAELLNGHVVFDGDGNASIAGGTHKQTSLSQYVSTKVNNETQTATNAISPAWGTMAGENPWDPATEVVNVSLGNNGKLRVSLPASLEVTKDIAIDPALGSNVSEDAFANTGFNIAVHVDGMAGKAATAHVENAQGETVGDASFTITFSEATAENPGGDYTHTLKNGETLVISGLPAGATYEVSEPNAGDGFTASYDEDTKTGTLASNRTAATTVTNTYSLEPVTANGADHFKGKKVLTGRAWGEDDSFTFTIAQTSGPQINGATVNALPNPVEQVVSAKTATEDGNDVATFNFGNVEYSVPGTYTYSIRENVPEQGQPGMSYFMDAYTVTVVVSDNHKGTMSVESTMTLNKQTVQDKEAVFTNYFTVNQNTFQVRALKTLDNQSGDANKNLTNNTFTAELRAVTVGAPMPADASAGADGSLVATAQNVDGVFTFGAMTFDNTMDGETFRYQITEQNGGQTIAGVAYDGATYYVDITVDVSPENEVSLTRVYTDAEGDQILNENNQNVPPTFSNVYNPDDATLAGEDIIHGDKTLTGRDFMKGEVFYFELAESAGNPEQVLESNIIRRANADVRSFDFGEMTFTKAGVYNFTVTEVADENGTALTDAHNINGMTYDKHTCAVTVTVVVDPEDAGKLKVDSVAYNNGENKPTDRAAFENIYESNLVYGTDTSGGLDVAKTLVGRNMNADEFEFTIAGSTADGAVSADEANAKLNNDADKSFKNGAANNGVADVMHKLRGLTFTQDDAGKTFVYQVSETKGQLDRVTYDEATYTVEIKVVDDLDGTMHTVTTVKNAEGGTVSGPATWDDRAVAESAVARVDFNNSYEPLPAEVGGDANTSLNLTKQFTGRAGNEWLDSDVFTFTLTGVGKGTVEDDGSFAVTGDAPMPEGTSAGHGVTVEKSVGKGDVTNSDNGIAPIDFGKITFTEEGVYQYIVSENRIDGADEKGIGQAQNQVYVFVTVTNDNGQLVANVWKDGENPDGISFKNTYSASIPYGANGQGGLDITKMLENKAIEDGKFSATITATGDNAAAAAEKLGLADGEKSTEVAFPAANMGEVVSASGNPFANIVFYQTDSGTTYTYTIVEEHAGETLEGITYDSSTYTVQITPTDNTDGTMRVRTVVKDSEGNTQIADVTTSAANPRKATVPFVNAYTASGDLPGAENLEVTKEFTGREGDSWLDTDSFSFRLEADTADDATKEAVGNNWITLPGNASELVIDSETPDHAASFGDIQFTKAGTYKFLVSEVQPTDDGTMTGTALDGATQVDGKWVLNGITYDNSVKTVTVNVVDNGDGRLTANVVTGDSDDLTFTNAYDTQDISVFSLDLGLEGNKVLTGREWETGDSFTFSITRGDCTYPNSDTKLPDDVANATMPDNTSVTITPATDGSDTSADGVTSARFQFGTNETVDVNQFTFSEPGTYRYLIEETNPNVTEPGSGILGVTYDETTYRLTVEVTDNGDGTLSETHSFTKQAAGTDDWVDVGSDEAITFTNAFSVNEVSPSFNVYKVFTGSDQAMTDNKFQFKIAAAGWSNNSDRTETVDTALAFDGDSSENPMPMVDGAVSDTVGSIIRGDVVFGDTTFTHDNVGKTYRYAVTEVQPTDDGTIDGEGLEGATFDDATGKWTYEGVTYDNATHYIYAKVVSQQIEQPENSGTYVEAVRVFTAGEAEYNNEQQAVVGDSVFTNTYAASGSLTGDAQLGVAKKVAGADFTADMTFNFTMKLTGTANGAALDGVQVAGADGQMVPLTDSGISKSITGGEGVTDGQKTVGFGDMTFTKAGDYTFTVAEDEADGTVPEHWTYDNADKTITVHVVDNNDGTLTVTVDPYDTTFTNTYFNPGEAKSAVAVDGNDKVTSQDGTKAMVGDTITYTINWMNNAVDENGALKNADVTVHDRIPDGTTLVEGSISDGGTVQDGIIIWTFDDQEPGASGSVSFQVTVDEGAAGTTVENAAWFNNTPSVTTNTIQTQVGAGDLTVSKAIELVEGQGTEIDQTKLFEFTLSLKDRSGNDLTADYAIEGAYDAEGNELTTVTNGSKFYLHHRDKATISALPDGAVAVVDETDILNDGYSQRQPANGVPGTDGIKAGKTANISFVNLYNADSSTVEEGTDKAFNLTKQFTGRDGNVWLEGDQFSFTLTAGSAYTLDDAADGKLDTPLTGVTVPMPADATDGAKTIVVGDDEEANADGIASIDFGKIEYARTGVYTYTVQEVGFDGTLGTGGYADGITYDRRTVNITVTVNDNGTGGLVAAVTKTGEAVNATDEDAAVSFRNTYDSTFDYGMNGNGGLDITKTLENHDMTAGQFAFTVTPANQNAIDKMGSGNAAQLASPAYDAGGAAIVSGNPLNNLTFNRADSGEGFVFTIDETTESGQGYICDPEVYTVTITPSDNGNGTMSVRTVVTSQAGQTVQDVTSTEDAPQKATIGFVNTYEPGEVVVGGDGQAQIVATKELQNDDVASHVGEFDFSVTSGNVMVAQGSNTADGGATVVFNPITYTASELYKAAHGGSEVIGKATPGTDENGNETWTFVYDVTEDPIAEGSSVSYVSGGGSVTVVVTDAKTGTLDVDVTYNNADGSEGIVFTNVYGAGSEAQLTLNGNKLFATDNAAWQAPTLVVGEFGFTIEGKAADGTPAPMPDVTYVENQGSAVAFGPITYTMENVFGTQATGINEAAGATDEGVETYTDGRTKVFTYTITESPDKTLPGVTNDTVAKFVTVTVTDNGDGTLSAKVTGVADGAATNMDFTFTNIYTVTPEKSTPTGDGGLTFTKKLDTQSGTRQLAEGDFTFQLTDDEGAVVADGTNDANGKVAMSAIEFTHAGDYSYTLTEVVPEGATPNADGSYTFEGVTYLPAQYAVTAHVVDNHDGTLTVTWDMTNADDDAVTTAQFVNVYNVDPTTVTFGAAKALEGREIAEGEFEFELKDAQGNVVATAANDADGAVTFEPQTFGDAGTYEFTISEVQGDAEGVTYDTTVYDVVLTLVDNDKGGLEVTELTYNGAAALPVFTNTYTEPPAPVEPDEVIPATGDAAVAAVAATVAIGGTLVAAGYVTSKKRGE